MDGEDEEELDGDRRWSEEEGRRGQNLAGRDEDKTPLEGWLDDDDEDEELINADTAVLFRLFNFLQLKSMGSVCISVESVEA